MSANATASTTGAVTIFTNGNGDGATTFNLPDCRGITLAGRENMGGTPVARLTSTCFSTNSDALGAVGGSQLTALAGSSQLTQFTPSGTIGGTGNVVNP